MIKKILKKALNVLVRINNWFDKDDEKIGLIVFGIVFLLMILILHKTVLFILTSAIIANGVIHRFGYWRRWELSILMEGVGKKETIIPEKRSSDDAEKKD